MSHLPWETLNDFVDDRLAPDVRAATAAHALQCPSCRAQLDNLRHVVALARALPSAPEGTSSGWERVAQSIRTQSVVISPRAWWQRPRPLLAAAVALIAVSSGLTALALRERGTSGFETVSAENPLTVSLPASWSAAEAGYLSSVEELRALLEQRRADLSPSTIAMVERSLATIDAAIVESRTALLRDPANATLADALAASYRHKVELLRRATQLDERS